VTNRKKSIKLIQFTIFLVALFLFYNTYQNKNESIKNPIKVESKINSDTNSFNNVTYSGFDLNGNRYTLQAEIAEFKTETPELINMKKVIANFYLKDNSLLKVVSNEGLYNNETFDMSFKEDVKASYLKNVMLSDQLNYSSSSGNLLASGNVRGESVEKGKFFADSVKYNLTNKILDFSMFGNNRVKVKIEDK
jgi:hypothetical protein|tara:strand:- start:141 stop:719 length:579 start_codon:yes stop_codon:yes gene_type:complete